MDGLKTLGLMAKDALKPIGLTVTGLHYYNLRLPQRKTRGVSICFDAETRDPNFFGRSYRNSSRIKVIDVLYQGLGGTAGTMFPGYEIYLDAYVNLKEPSFEVLPSNDEPELRQEFVDVTKNQDVRLVPIGDLIQSGEVAKGSMFDHYCKTYGLPFVLKHGWNHISPDSVSVEALNAICDSRLIGSVLEIGAGVGICGEAAKRHGIADLTFIDASPNVCAYLQQRFPQYRTIHGDAFNFDPKNSKKQYDLVLMGLPYELNPLFLEKRGWDLAAHAETVVFQSGVKAFFEFEHDWIAGKPNVANWPWWNEAQTLKNYFHYVFEMAFDWQLCLVGTRDRNLARDYERAMINRNFEYYPSSYAHLKI